MPTFAGENGGLATTELGGFKSYDDEPEYLYSTMLFQQATAPVGWVKETDPTLDNCALTITNKTNLYKPYNNASNTFTFDFSPTGTLASTFTVSGSVGATTISTAMLPSHTHTMGGRNNPPGGVTYFANFKQPNSSTTAVAFAPSYSGASPSSGSSNSTGIASGSSGHTHTVSNINISFTYPDMNFSVKYVDAIIATRY